MSDIRYLIRGIQHLIKAIRQEELILKKDQVTKFRVRFVWNGEEGFNEYITSDGEEAAAWFVSDTRTPDSIKDIVESVIIGEKWFKIMEVSGDIFEIDGKKYLVEKAAGLNLTYEDIKKLVEEGLTELSADAVTDIFPMDEADEWWERERGGK
ncbi:MAG: hypothetical protein RQ862_03480 [Candidatus Caldarchaeales archaeon]|nr:hypothetical protein [Candidatus Caldarchaeales archaeon]